MKKYLKRVLMIMCEYLLLARNRHLMDVQLSQQILQEVAKLCRHFGHESHSKLCFGLMKYVCNGQHMRYLLLSENDSRVREERGEKGTFQADIYYKKGDVTLFLT